MRFPFFVRLLLTLGILTSVCALAQTDTDEIPLGDVARNLRKVNPPSQSVIDDDNFSQVMEQVEGRHAAGSAFRYLMAGEVNGFQISAPDATCSLSFSSNAKALLSTQYAQMELPPVDIGKLSGPATIDGDVLSLSLFNGTDWHVSEVSVALTIVRKSQDFIASASVPQETRAEKKPDATAIYRMRAAAPPFATAAFTAPLGRLLESDEEWHWAIVQARGYPPRIESAKQLAPAAIPMSLTLPMPAEESLEPKADSAAEKSDH